MLAISVILSIKVLMFIIVSVTAVSATAVSNRYLRGQPLPYALGNNWGLAGKGTSLADLTNSCSLTGSYKSSK